MRANLNGYVTCRQRCLILQECVGCVCVHMLFITHILIILVCKHMLTRTKHYCLSAVGKGHCIILLTRSRSHKRISSPSIINSPLNLGDGQASQRNIHLAPTSSNINISVIVVAESRKKSQPNTLHAEIHTEGVPHTAVISRGTVLTFSKVPTTHYCSNLSLI